MLCDAPSTRRFSPFAAARTRARPPEPRDALEARRREVRALLEEIRAPSPTTVEADLPGPADILKAVQEATEGRLCHDKLDRIEARIAALYGAG